jgi:hypothetical protein
VAASPYADSVNGGNWTTLVPAVATGIVAGAPVRLVGQVFDSTEHMSGSATESSVGNLKTSKERR